MYFHLSCPFSLFHYPFLSSPIASLNSDCTTTFHNPSCPSFQFVHQTSQDLYQPSMAYLKKRSFTLRTVAPSDSSARRAQTLLIRSSTTLFTSSVNTATSRGRMMSCLSTLRIFSHSSPSLEKRGQGLRFPFPCVLLFQNGEFIDV